MSISFKAASSTSSRFALGGYDLFLYCATVLAWGFSWYAIKLQGGVAVEISLFWRFFLAAIGMLIWAAVRGHKLRFGLTQHLGFALLGALLFCINFLFFYNGTQLLPSGLVSVVFSLASVLNLALGFLLFGQRQSLRVLAGGLLGFGGVLLMFWPQFGGANFDQGALIGLGLCAAGTLSFSCANMVSARLQSFGISVVSAGFWGMIYGSGYLAIAGLVRGSTFTPPADPVYLGALLYLVVIASVVAFGSYLTLLGRIGSARAGYATVMFPVLALLVSTALEGYQWTWFAVAGLTSVLIGNILVLTRG
ncbi:DMT family transporter [Polycladidibacter hongkongensis]|uniref:DMT family transporter n=1 Tax=Polycladidibacter hongkongensis TaxID=1647556 RepID=UPI000836BD04|nr:DMT family transporter [Pseudovibrio hongkongensis]